MVDILRIVDNKLNNKINKFYFILKVFWKKINIIAKRNYLKKLFEYRRKNIEKEKNKALYNKTEKQNISKKKPKKQIYNIPSSL